MRYILWGHLMAGIQFCVSSLGRPHQALEATLTSPPHGQAAGLLFLVFWDQVTCPAHTSLSSHTLPKTSSI